MAGLRARVVIDDCRVAIETLDECEFGPEWRRSWVTVVALLRAVGHVLQKVDARTDARMAEVIRQQYESLKRSKPEPAIYWAFIEGERNNVRKEYQFSGRHASSTTSASSMSLAVGNGQIVTVTRDPPGELHMHVFNEGPFVGRHQVAVAKAALAWWESYLAEVETRLRE